jgi:hypothetical protein
MLTRLTDNEKKILSELKKNPYELLRTTHKQYANNANIMRELVKTNPFTFTRASDTLQNDRTFVLAAFTGYHVKVNLLKHVPKEFQDDEEIVLAAIKCETMNFKFAPESLKNDRTFVLAAVKKDAKLFKLVPKKFKNDLDFVIQAAKANYKAMHNITLNYTKECGYVRYEVEHDGNSGCTGVGVTRAEAYRLLKDNPKKAGLIEPAVLKEFYKGGRRVYPSILQAIARVKGITLYIWQEKEDGTLTSYEAPIQPKNSTKTIHLIYRHVFNYMHFDLAKFVGNVDFNKPIFPHYLSWIQNEVEDHPVISFKNMNKFSYVELTGDEMHDFIESASSYNDDEFDKLMSCSKKCLAEIEELTDKKREKFKENSNRGFFKKIFNKNAIVEIDKKIKKMWDKKTDIQRSLVYRVIYLFTGTEKQQYNASEVVRFFGKDGCFIKRDIYENLCQTAVENASKNPHMLKV